jgi:hypothetical protein
MYIVSPPKNTKSAGSMILYNLRDQLRAHGVDAERWIIAQDRSGQFHISFNEKEFTILDEKIITDTIDATNTVIIHGENLHYKYFKDFNVARYYLNKIGRMKNIGVPREREFKITWDQSFVDDADFELNYLYIKKPQQETIYEDKNRNIDLTYVGKGIIYDQSFKRLSNTIELTRNWPNNDDEYVFLLSKARFIFSYDTISSVLNDAIYYGAIPILMTTLPYSSAEDLLNAAGEKMPILTSDDLNNLMNSGELDSYLTLFNEFRRLFIEQEKHSEIKFFNSLPTLVEQMALFFNIK